MSHKPMIPVTITLQHMRYNLSLGVTTYQYEAFPEVTSTQ